MRAHIILPEETVRAIDALVGKGKRSKFIEEAVTEKLRIERQLKALDSAFGAISAEEAPHWATPEKTYQWIRNLREEADRSMQEKWKERG